MNCNKKIAFLGYGDLAKQIYTHIGCCGNNIVIFDSTFSSSNLEVFPFDSYLNYSQQFNWVVSIGYKHLAKKTNIIKSLLKLDSTLYSFIHPTSYISPNADIHPGAILYPMCNIDLNVTISPGVFLNNSVTVSHDSTIGIGTYISPGVTISGNVILGEGCFIGSGSIISNNITIGNNVVIGPGTVVTQNIPDNCHVIGNPMRTLDKHLNLI